MTPEFRRMGLLDVENIIETIDEVFGYRPMKYDVNVNILEFGEPIVFAECSFIHFIGVGITKENKTMYKMYNEDDNYYYYIDGFEI